MKFFRRRRDLDARVASARDRAETAGDEVRLSSARQEAIREHIVEPLKRAAEHNQFAALIRETLTDGNGGK